MTASLYGIELEQATLVKGDGIEIGEVPDTPALMYQGWNNRPSARHACPDVSRME